MTGERDDASCGPTPGRAQTFRLFVSSTFQDLRAERNALHAHVFPRLRELCRRHGCRFQAIDLRWGVSGEAARDQQTMIICLREIERCRRVTPRPNFLVLLGQRYGWRPPPPRIPASEFEALLAHVSSDDAALLCWKEGQPPGHEGWYRHDVNANPIEYRLRPRYVDLSGCDTPEKAEAARQAEAESWKAVEHRLQRALEHAAEQVSLPNDARLLYAGSATAQEIAAGALSATNPEGKVSCFFRTIEGAGDARGDLLPGTEKFIDSDPTLLDALKAELERKLKGDAGAVTEYKAHWTSEGPSTDSIGTLPEDLDACLALLDAEEPPASLCAGVWRRLARTILQEIEHPTALPAMADEKIRVTPDKDLDFEGRAHCDSANDLLRAFVGREAPRRAIRDYLAGEGERPLAVVASGGAGKSALMAKALEEAKQARPEAQIVYRFIGTTPSSSDARSLLDSLCREISRRCGGRESVLSEYTDLVAELEKLMARATAKRPLLLFVDALDQLSEAHGARSLVWLPRRLPAGVRVVLSTRREADTFAAVTRLGAELVELGPMSRAEGEKLLDLWLDDARRRLTPVQRTRVLDAFENERSGGRPLYLRLAFEEARLWPSYTPPEDLEPGIDGVIQTNLFPRLAREENHGEALVARTVGYLAASRYGLAEDELIDVLSRDADLYTAFLQGSFHLPSDLVARAIEHRRARGADGPERDQGDVRRAETWLRALIADPNRSAELRQFLEATLSRPDGPRLPVVLWSRLYFDLAPYLRERMSDGTSLLGFYHRELGEVGAKEFAGAQRGRDLHSRLADYFDARELSGRKITELPWQLAQAGLWERLFGLLADEEFFTTGWMADRFDMRAHWTRLEDSSTLRMADAYAPVLKAATREGRDRSAAEIFHTRYVADLLAAAGHHEQALILRRYLLDYHRRVGEPLVVAMFLDDVAMSCRALGRMDEALAALRAEREIEEGQAGTDPPANAQRIKTLNQLGVLLTDVGRLDEAQGVLGELERLARAAGDRSKLAACMANQARLLILRGQPREAIGLLETAEQIWRADGDLDGLNHALGNLGAALAEVGDIDRAEMLFAEEEQICRRIGDTDGLIRALSGRVQILNDRGDSDGAAKLLAEQERLGSRSATRAGLAACLGARAAIASRKGERQAALALLEQEERIYRELANLPVLVGCLGRKAALLFEAGDLEGALRPLQEREKICRELALKYHLATTLGLRGVLLQEQHDLGQALESFREQERLGSELGDAKLVAQALGGQASVLKDHGECDEALEAYRRAERASRAAGDLEILRSALAEQADILIEQGDLDDAQPIFQELEQVCRRIGHKRGLAHSLDSQGTILRVRGDLDGALDKHEEAVGLLRETGKPADLAAALGNRGVALRGKGDAVAAEESYVEAEAIWRRIGDEAGLQRLLGNRGNLLLVTGDLQGALRLFTERAEICRRIEDEAGLQKSLMMQRMVLDQMRGAQPAGEDGARRGGQTTTVQKGGGGSTGIFKRKPTESSDVMEFRDKEEDDMNCDVCNQTMDPRKGYILSTSQVAYDPGYWKRAFGLLSMSAEQLERNLPSIVRQLSSSQSDWIVCDQCMSFLKADRSTSGGYYQNYVKTGTRPLLPDSGPANLDRTAIVASGAFETIFGRKPVSITMGEAPGKVLGSVEFSQKLAEIMRSRDMSALRKLVGGVQVKCGACGAVMPALECKFTDAGMSCPRCDQPWIALR